MKHDKECMTCEHLFECEGKPDETEQCIKYKERKGENDD